MPAGDFVRWARQVIDLLGQIAQADRPTLADAGARPGPRWTRCNRGVLAYTSLT